MNAKIWTASVGLLVVLGACAPEEDSELDAHGRDSMDENDMLASESDTVDKGTMWRLDVVRNGSGTVTGINQGDNRTVISCGSDCNEQFVPFFDQTVVLTATPAPGETFAGWSGSCSGSSPVCYVRVGMGIADVTANFVGQPKITLNASGANGWSTMTAGPQSGAGPTVTCSSTYNGMTTCTGNWPVGTPMKVEVYPGRFTSTNCPNPVVVTHAIVNGKISELPRSTCSFTLNGDIALSGKYAFDTAHF